MSKALFIILAIAAASVVSIAGLIYLFAEEDEEQQIESISSENKNQIVDWSAEKKEVLGGRSTVPPKPIFNAGDNDECRELLADWYDDAVEYNEKYIRLDKSYSGVLARQTRYGIEIVNNQQFYEFAVSGEQLVENDDWLQDQFNDYWKGEYMRVFGSYDDGSAADRNGLVKAPIEPEKLLRTIDELDQAMYVLYQFRYYQGLEDQYHWGRRRRMLLSFAFIGPQDYEMCSENTKDLAEILAELVNRGMPDWRDQYYYPLLDNMITWLDRTYG